MPTSKIQVIFLNILLILTFLTETKAEDAPKVQIGDSTERVYQVLGSPSGEIRFGQKILLHYHSGEIEITEGIVSRVEIENHPSNDPSSASILNKTPGYVRKVYGSPLENNARDRHSPLIRLEGANTKTYRVNDGWTVRVGYFNGKAQRIIYQKRYIPGSGYEIKDDEWAALIRKHQDGKEWQSTTTNKKVQSFLNLRGTGLTRSDGVKVSASGPFVRFETKEILDAEHAYRNQLEAERIKRIPK